MFKRVIPFTIALSLSIQPLWAITSGSDELPAVKMSSTNICHEKGSQHYQQVKKFTPFASIKDCLKHGRLPKQNSSAAPAPVAPPKTPTSRATAKYDRKAFGGWGDDDKNCLNTRHEILKAQSVSTVQMKSRCAVEKGRWNDPYTGKTFYNAQDLDIDHIVPLAYAWDHGADRWSDARREAFANDPINLLAVDRSTNRDKGMKGPTQWLPPAKGFRCQYLLRFERIVISYQLKQSASEKKKLEALNKQYCS